MEQNVRLTINTKENVLRQVLHQFDVPDSAFSIGSSAEQRVCLEKKDDKFHVYVVERGIKFDESQHQTEYAAHLEMFHQLAATDSEYHKMCDIYKQTLKNSENMLQNTFTETEMSKRQQISMPSIAVGDIVRIYFKTTRSTREFRIKRMKGATSKRSCARKAPVWCFQGLRVCNKAFEGTVVSQMYSSAGNFITVRCTSRGIAIEKTFSLSSPNISKVEIVRKGRRHGANLRSMHDKRHNVNAIKKK